MHSSSRHRILASLAQPGFVNPGRAQNSKKMSGDQGCQPRPNEYRAKKLVHLGLTTSGEQKTVECHHPAGWPSQCGADMLC